MGELGGLFRCAEESYGLFALSVTDALEVEEADERIEVEDVVAVVLACNTVIVSRVVTRLLHIRRLTSFPATGFSDRLTCFNLVKFCSGSRSASSAILFCVRTSVLRFGIRSAIEGWIVVIRFRASRRLCSRGESGKLPRTEMSLSVKSMHSWSLLTPYRLVQDRVDVAYE